MASRTHSSKIQTLTRQLAGLRTRVKRLEQAIGQEPKTSEPVAQKTAERDWKQHDAMMRAWMEYDNQRDLADYREDPTALEGALESERKRFAFFRERGITPPKSRLEEIARLIQAETAETRSRETVVASN